MLPANSIITHHLAREYHLLLKGCTLARVEYQREARSFLFSFDRPHQYHLRFSFSPPDFVLLNGLGSSVDSIEIWLEVAGSRVESVQGPANDRLITFVLAKSPEAGAVRHLSVVFELLGALSNAFLLDDIGKILQATRVVNDGRGLKPGGLYQPPQPLQGEKEGTKIPIVKTEEGEFVLDIGASTPQVLLNHGSDTQPWTPESQTPLVDLFEHLHRTGAEPDRLSSLRQSLLGSLNRQIKKQRSILTDVEKKLEQSEQAESIKQLGDILMANPKAESSEGKVTLHDFYNDAQVTIPLLPGKNVIETATSYYKRAKKLARAPEKLKQRVSEISDSIRELEQAMLSVREAERVEQLETLRGDLKLTSGSSKSAKANAERRSLPYRLYHSSAGEKILVGKSAVGNAELTFRIARGYDYWFHAQQAKGSHVILMLPDKNQKPNKSSIREAAELAAHFSDAGTSENVPVIFTQRRYVRKVRNGPPGKVIPERVESIFVTPRKPSAESS